MAIDFSWVCWWDGCSLRLWLCVFSSVNILCMCLLFWFVLCGPRGGQRGRKSDGERMTGVSVHPLQYQSCISPFSLFYHIWRSGHLGNCAPGCHRRTNTRTSLTGCTDVRWWMQRLIKPQWMVDRLSWYKLILYILACVIFIARIKTAVLKAPMK